MYSTEAWLHFCGPDRSCEIEISDALGRCGLRCRSLNSAHTLSATEPHGILCFSHTGADVFETLDTLRRQSRVIALAASEDAVEPCTTWQLLHRGAADVLIWDGVTTPSHIAARFERWRKVDELMEQTLAREGLIGRSSAWWTLIRNVVEAGRFASTPILLTGESGTGKELLAQVIHAVSRNGERKLDQLVTVDCSTIVPELSGSELFGHERGAFTGAHMLREGAFALANGATLFLDEIGELPLTLQTQLLRVIQEKNYKRVGDTIPGTVQLSG